MGILPEEKFSEAFSISLFLNDPESLPKPCLAYVTLLLAAHPTSMIMLYSSQRMGMVKRLLYHK